MPEQETDDESVRGPKMKTQTSDRWTPRLAKNGHTAIVNDFLDHYAELGITQAEAMFLIHLFRHKWDKRAPFPSYRKIADRMGIERRRATALAASLEKKGLLERILRPRANDRSETNEFNLGPLLSKLEQCADRARAEKERERERQRQAKGSMS